MSKYQNLALHLSSLDIPRWAPTFREIEKILGFPLPKSAYSYPAWWANQAGEGHSQSGSWQSVGWRTGELDLSNQRVSFFREKKDSGHQAVADTTGSGRQSIALTISEAKAGLAANFGVPLES